jgi:hypothetical protein
VSNASSSLDDLTDSVDHEVGIIDVRVMATML